MKKLISAATVLALSLSLGAFTPKNASADTNVESNVTEEQKPIDKLNDALQKEGAQKITEDQYFDLANEALEKARIEVNKQLEEGKEDIKVEEKIGDQDSYGTVTF